MSAAAELPLLLADLQDRHAGLTQEIAEYYAQAAAVCLSRHHSPPAALMVSGDDRRRAAYQVDWSPPTERQRAGWANADDATRDGAYCVVLAAAERHLGLVAVARAAVRTGADYYVAPPGAEINLEDGQLDLENAIRLEVSGIDRCAGDAALLSRVRRKIKQARQGQSSTPGLVGVVAFSLLRALFRRA